MVNTEQDLTPSPNGAADRRLPTSVTLSKADLQSFPSPGTQRALKAETGRDYMALVGPDADSADRTQTQIWTHLRRTIRDLRWAECDEIELTVGDDLNVDPTEIVAYAPSPGSAASGE